MASLGDWWEGISFTENVGVGPGRNKKLLWKKYFAGKFCRSDFGGKSILDMGCNAGGNLIELSYYSPKRLVGIDANSNFIKQAEFVKHWFSLDCTVREYRLSPDKTKIDYAVDLGYFDVIFCLGIIYHLDRKTSLEMLKYIKENSQRAIVSTQLFASDYRPQVDWDVSRLGTIGLIAEAGFAGVKDIYIKSEVDDWSGLTNQWYFELIW